MTDSQRPGRDRDTRNLSGHTERTAGKLDPQGASRRPRIAILDYSVTRSSPIGSCHLAILEHLASDFDFTVFAAEFQNPHPERIRFVRVPVPMRPLALLYFAFHLAIIPAFYWAKWVRGWKFDLVQSTESYTLLGDVCYAHFCHRSYLKKHWLASAVSGLRGKLRWLDHRVRAAGEECIYARASAIVVPSIGLRRELSEEYPETTTKTITISNPVDIERFTRPADFARAAFRAGLGIGDGDIVQVFVALGHFERKGLPFILDAMANKRQSKLKLLVVGGRGDLVSSYENRVASLGLENSVVFVGVQEDVRPYLWASDVFVFPSLYEAFSLVTLQTSAAGLPLLAGRINGVDELLVDGENGILIECTSEGVQRGLQQFLAMDASQLDTMSQAAVARVQRFSSTRFAEAWLAFYKEYLEDARSRRT